MNIYAYDPQTGEFIGLMQAKLDPEETRIQGTNVYAHPAHTTEVSPPAPEEGKKPVWDGADWIMVEDHRGETWFDGNRDEVEIKSLGDPTVSDLTSTPLAFTLEEAKNDAKLKIRDWKIINQDSPFAYTVNAVEYQFQNDHRSRQLIAGNSQLALMASLASEAFSIEWTAADDSIVTLNADEMIGLDKASIAHTEGFHTLAARAKASINRATLVTGVQVILDALMGA